MGLKRFVHRIEKAAGDPSTTTNVVVSFEDYKLLKGVSWVGSHGNNVDIELKSQDGKTVLVDSVPVEYLRLGQNREELTIEETINNNSIRVEMEFITGSDVKGSLVFTLED